MTRLTQIAITTRKIIRYGIFFVIFLIVARILFTLGSKVYLKLFPPPPPAPTVAFDKLPVLPFPKKDPPPALTFSLETTEGGLPVFPVQTKVYFMPKLSAKLLSLDVAKQNANALGFIADEQKLSETLYQFIKKEAPANLQINIATGVFSIGYDVKNDPTVIAQRPPTGEVATSLARSYLSGAGLMPEDLGGPTTSIYLKINDNKFVPAVSLSEALAVKVNLFRTDYDKLPVLPPNPDQANVWFLVSGSRETGKQIIAGEFHYFPVDSDKASTYPIITSSEAWSQFLAGKAYVARLGANKEGDAIKIRKVYLAYFDPNEAAQFFQPIVVFEGDRGFMAYLPAVTAQYYSQE